MKKLIFITLGALIALSTISLAGQGYYVTINNDTDGTIQFTTISDLCWNYYDMPKNNIDFIALGQGQSKTIYTESKSFEPDYICAGIETPDGIHIGTFGFIEDWDINYPANWPNTNVVKTDYDNGDDCMDIGSYSGYSVTGTLAQKGRQYQVIINVKNS